MLTNSSQSRIDNKVKKQYRILLCENIMTSELTFMLHHSVMHSQQKRCPQGVDVVCLLSSRQRIHRATRGPVLRAC